MSTVAEKLPAKTQPTALQQQVWEFKPFMSNETIKLSLGIVKSFVAVPTRSGALPVDRDIVRFITLCKARGLNPFEGDAYLVGYDSKNGPTFSLITAHQALIKRAEIHPEYDGMESGVLVESDGNVVPREGSFFLATDKLVGAWATVYFKTRSHPMKKTVRLSTYNTGRSRWEADPAGMIVKVAEAAALRASFPNTLGGMYLREEYNDDGNTLDMTPAPTEAKPKSSGLEALAERLMPSPPANGKGHHEDARDDGYHQPDDTTQAPPDEPLGVSSEDLEQMFSACKTPADLSSLIDRLKGPDSPIQDESLFDCLDALEAATKSRLSRKKGQGALDLGEGNAT